MAKISKKIREEIYARDKGCLICGTKSNLTIDHIVPTCKGGVNEKRNYQTLCELHNNIKGNNIADYRGNTNFKPLSNDEVIEFVWKAVVYDNHLYRLYGYLTKRATPVYAIGSAVYYNKELNKFVLGSKEQMIFDFDILIGIIQTKDERLNKQRDIPIIKSKPHIYAPYIPKSYFPENREIGKNIDFDHPNIQSIRPPKVKNGWFSEIYSKEEQKNFHY